MATNKSNTTKPKDKPLRFAALVRVSTEKQAKRGESLTTQTNDITQAVKALGGKVTKWYRGQQHATEGFEQQMVDEMLADAQKKRRPFDAIMVVDLSRWSRDNGKSKVGLRLLKDNGIRFFTLGEERDLFDPNVNLFLGMSAEIGEWQANEQAKKSIRSRIERAKRGLPSSGGLPFGRTFDKKTEEWGLDPKKHKQIKEAAKRYLSGESIKDLAAEIGVTNVTLHNTLTRRCGDVWEQNFEAPKLGIGETVKTTVPRLLPDRTIKAILKRVERNRTWVRGHNKLKYLLAGKVFCEVCGRSLSPQHAGAVRYYRPAQGCKCVGGFVRADGLEANVARELFQTLGNPKALEEAIKQARPNSERVKEAQARQEKIDADLSKVKRARAKFKRAMDDDLIPEDEVRKDLAKLREREHRLEDEAERLAVELANVPNDQSVKRIAVRLANKKRDIAHDYEGMTWDEKRAMIERAFDGMTAEGRPQGCYVSSIPGHESKRPRPFAYWLRGDLAIMGGGHTNLDPEIWDEASRDYGHVKGSRWPSRSS